MVTSIRQARTEGVDATSQDSRNIAVLVWIGTLLFGFIPGLIAYLLKRGDAHVAGQGKEALNSQITALIWVLAGFILLRLHEIGVLVMVMVCIGHLVICIMGAVAGSRGKPFRVPFAIHLIK